MNKQNICFIGHGKMIQGIIKKFDLEKFSLSIVTRSNKHNEFDQSALSYTQADIKSDSFPTQLIQNADIVVFTLPPLDIENFKTFFKQCPLDKTIIFTSSISVYQKHQGNIDERGQLVTKEENKLVECETFLKEHFKNLIILRLGGLYGKNRHPIYSLSGKTNVKGSSESIHLVHHENVQEAILKLIKLNVREGIYNIISDSRENKKNYYSRMANKLHLPLPLFENEERTEIKPNNISNQKSKDDLELTYYNPNDFLGVENE